MAKYQVLDGSAPIFATDDEGMLRNFLLHPGTNNPMLSDGERTRITELLAQLPDVLPDQLTIEERSGAIHLRLRIVIGKKSWKCSGS